MGGINISTKCTVEYIEVEGASCPRNKTNKYFYRVILGYIEVEGVSCPRNRKFNCFYKVYCRMY
jgi:CxxC motif-containing protein